MLKLTLITKKLSLLYLENRILYYQILIILSELIALELRALFYFYLVTNAVLIGS